MPDGRAAQATCYVLRGRHSDQKWRPCESRVVPNARAGRTYAFYSARSVNSEYTLNQTVICISVWYICVKVPSAQKDRTDPSVGRSRVRECGTTNQRPCAAAAPTEL